MRPLLRCDAISWRQLGGIMTAKGENRRSMTYKRALLYSRRMRKRKPGSQLPYRQPIRGTMPFHFWNLLAHCRLSVLYRHMGRDDRRSA